MSSVVTIDIAGFSAVVDAYAWEQDFSGRYSYTPKYKVWFLSMVGVNASVDAIWARLLKGEAATMTLPIPDSIHGRRCVFTLASEAVKSWKRYKKHLPLAAGHQLVMSPEALRIDSKRTDFVMLFRDTDELAPNLHYRLLDARTMVPLHASWEHWLWERALRIGETVKLESHRCAAYRCVPNVANLKSDLAGAIRTGMLSVEDVNEVAA